jgi:hypothetical protein
LILSVKVSILNRRALWGFAIDAFLTVRIAAYC